VNRRTATTDPAGGVTTLAYDGAGNVTVATDPVGQMSSAVQGPIQRPSACPTTPRPDR
jgi:YD repeat-containing protein